MTLARLVGMLLLSFGLLCGQPLDAILVLETSPGTERATDLVRPNALGEDDRAGVVAFFHAAYLLQPLTENRDAIAAALQRAGSRVGAAVGGPERGQIGSNFTVDLVEALETACGELERRGESDRKRAIVVFIAGDDPRLSAHRESLKSMLSAAEARLYVVVIQRVSPSAIPGTTRTGIPPLSTPTPVETAQLLSELAEESGGRIYRRNWNLKEIFERAR